MQSNLGVIINFSIELDVRVWLHEVPIKDWSLVEYFVQSAFKLAGYLFFEQTSEPVSVFVVDQPVLEHPQILVVPQTIQLVFTLEYQT